MGKEIYDVAIIGAGVCGVSIFNDLILRGYNVVLLEKEQDVSVGTTKANSGIIHAGFDAKPGTLKAKLNVEGNLMFPDICARINVPLVKCGAYVIGNDESVVDELVSRAKDNNVKGVKKLDRKALKQRLNNITDNITTGLFAENSYIIEPYFYTICLAEEAVHNGGKLMLDFDVTKAKLVKDIWTISSKNSSVNAKIVINASGFAYNQVAKILGAEQYDIQYRRGEYYVLDHSERNIVPSTIFPLPTKDGKGVLVTPTASGNILVGPTSYISTDDTITTESGLKDIATKSSSMLNNVNLGKAIRVFSGVRTVVGDDFVIAKSNKAKNVVNLAGICSPGLSSAPAIANYVRTMLGMNNDLKKGLKQLSPYTKLSELSVEEKNRLIAKNKDYGKIVCKCENITLGEIKDAINRPIKPTTMDGIKRRIRPGMGRCQGGFCNDKVALILAKENKMKLEDIVKEKKDGKYIVGNVTSKGEK